MAEMRKRTSMSVLEMGRMLGLGKTESYWLIKKNYFKTILVGNTMRVMIDSFEEWYANQFKYQKVDGKQRKGSCRLNMSRSPEPLFPLLLKPSMIFWMSICQSMV